jgi:hypothetical protein
VPRVGIIASSVVISDNANISRWLVNVYDKDAYTPLSNSAAEFGTCPVVRFPPTVSFSFLQLQVKTIEMNTIKTNFRDFI